MKQTNVLKLRDIMGRSTGWGREEGRALFTELLAQVDELSEAVLFRIDLRGVEQLDASYPRESFVALAKRFAGDKAFALMGVASPDLLDNIDAAAQKQQMPMVVWHEKGKWTLIGPAPSAGLRETFEIAMKLGQVTTAELSRPPHQIGSPANVSNKLKLLADQGYLVRREESASTGGKEFLYLAPR